MWLFGGVHIGFIGASYRGVLLFAGTILLCHADGDDVLVMRHASSSSSTPLPEGQASR